MAKVVRDGRCVLAVVRERVARRVTQHVGMHGESDLRPIPCPSYDLADGGSGSRSASLSRE